MCLTFCRWPACLHCILLLVHTRTRPALPRLLNPSLCACFSLTRPATHASGISNYTPAHIVELLSSCRVPPDLLQSEHHPFFTNAHVRKACRAHGIAFMAYGPLSGGQAERRQGQKGVHNRVVLEVASSCGKTPSQVLLRWATQRGVAVLPKSHREAGIRENANARGFRLSDAAMARLESLETGQPTYWDPNCVDSLDHFVRFTGTCGSNAGPGIHPAPSDEYTTQLTMHGRATPDPSDSLPLTERVPRQGAAAGSIAMSPAD